MRFVSISFEQLFILYKILTGPRGMFENNIFIDQKTAGSDNQKGGKSTIHNYILLFQVLVVSNTGHCHAMLLHWHCWHCHQRVKNQYMLNSLVQYPSHMLLSLVPLLGQCRCWYSVHCCIDRFKIRLFVP